MRCTFEIVLFDCGVVSFKIGTLALKANICDITMILSFEETTIASSSYFFVITVPRILNTKLFSILKILQFTCSPYKNSPRKLNMRKKKEYTDQFRIFTESERSIRNSTYILHHSEALLNIKSITANSSPLDK
jgi:hypothetical protein